MEPLIFVPSEILIFVPSEGWRGKLRGQASYVALPSPDKNCIRRLAAYSPILSNANIDFFLGTHELFYLCPQVSAFNAILLLVLSMSMPSQRLQRMMNYFFVVWASIVVFGLMFYQLRFVNEDILKYNCTAQGIVSLFCYSLLFSLQGFPTNSSSTCVIITHLYNSL